MVTRFRYQARVTKILFLFWSRLVTLGHFLVLVTVGHVWSRLVTFGHGIFGYYLNVFGHSRLISEPSDQNLVLDTFGHVWSRTCFGHVWSRLVTFGHGPVLVTVGHVWSRLVTVKYFGLKVCFFLATVGHVWSRPFQAPLLARWPFSFALAG